MFIQVFNLKKPHKNRKYNLLVIRKQGFNYSEHSNGELRAPTMNVAHTTWRISLSALHFDYKSDKEINVMKKIYFHGSY